MIYVTRYETSREYGGPEEGGWWYDWNENPRPVVALPDGYEGAAYEIARNCNDAERGRREGENGFDRFSVLGDYDFTYAVEEVLGEYESNERPHYE